MNGGPVPRAHDGVEALCLPGVDEVTPLVRGLAERGLTLAVAESLTGGLVMATLTQVPGSSTVLRGGVVAYAEDVKTAVLGVPSALLARVGPVHPEVAAAMAVGCRDVLRAAIGVSTTGEAGPQPASSAAVGTFHVAVAGPDGVRGASGLVEGSRQDVRAGAVALALRLLATTLPGA